MKRLCTILTLLMAMLLCACQRETPDGAFLSSDGAELKIGGRKILEYDPLSCQMSFNRASRQFAVVSDDGASYYRITLSEIPYEPGKRLTADIAWTSGVYVKSRNNVALDVFRVEGDRIWLWNARLDIEVSLDILH